MRYDGLTERRHRIAQLVAEGFTDQMIADELRISKRGANATVHAIAAIWRLDPTKDIRVQITQRVRHRPAA